MGATGDRPVADPHRGATAQCSADGAVQSRRLRFDRRMSALHCTGLHWVALGGLRHTSRLLEHDTCRAVCMQHDTCDETFGMARAMQRATMRWQANLFEQHYFLDFYTFKLDIIDHHGLVFMRLLRASKG
jgi:hypothetical protein